MKKIVSLLILGVTLLVSPAITLAQAPTSRGAMSFIGAYNSSVIYTKGDVVTEGASAFISVVINNRAHDPATDGGSHWAILGSKGDPGPSGVSPAVLAAARVATTYTPQTNLFDVSGTLSGQILDNSTGVSHGFAGYITTPYIAANAGGQMVANADMPGTVTLSGDADQSSTINLWNNADATSGVLFGTGTGCATEPHAGYSESPYILVNGLSVIRINATVQGGNSSGGWGACFYNASHALIGVGTVSQPPGGTNATDWSTVNIMAGAYYVRVGMSTDLTSGGIISAYLPTGSCTSFPMAVAGNTYPTGCTSFVPVSTSTATGGVSFYDTDKTIISGVSGPITSGTAFSVPSTAAYIRATFTGDPSVTLMIVNGATVPSSYVNFGTYARNTIDNKITTALGSVTAPLTAVWPAMQGLEWWLPFTDNTGTTASDIVTGAHSGAIAGSGTAAVWLGTVGIVPNAQTITLPNAGGGTSMGYCAYMAESNISYIFGLAVGGQNGINLRGGYGPNTNQYNGGHAYYPSIAASNGGNVVDSLDGLSGVHCVEGVFTNPGHLIVDGKEIAYLDQGDATFATGTTEMTAPIYIQSGGAAFYSAWATSSTTTETVAKAIARTSSEVARLKSLGVAFGSAKNDSLAFSDSTCNFQGTSIDQGFQAGNVLPSSLLSLDFPCTIHDYSISGQGSRDMDMAFDTRDGANYHPKAAKNIAYHGGVTNSLTNFTQPVASALQDVLSWNRKAHALGYKTIATTMMSRGGADSLAQAYNALLLAVGDEFDWVDNLAANVHLGATGASANTTYFADGTHPNTTGQALYVAAERAAFEGVYGNPNATVVGSNYTQLDSDRLVVFNGSSASTITLKDATLMSFNKQGKVCFKNVGSASLTLSPVNSETINGSSSLVVSTGNTACLFPYVANPAAAGANWITVQP